MKKMISALSAAALTVCSLTSCGGSSSSSEETSSSFVPVPVSELRTAVGTLRTAADSAAADMDGEGYDISGRIIICSDTSRDLVSAKIDPQLLADDIKEYYPDAERISYIVVLDNGECVYTAAASSFDSDDIVEFGSLSTGCSTLSDAYCEFAGMSSDEDEEESSDSDDEYPLENETNWAQEAESARKAASAAYEDISVKDSSFPRSFVICSDISLNKDLTEAQAEQFFVCFDQYYENAFTFDYVLAFENGKCVVAAVSDGYDSENMSEAGDKSTGEDTLSDIIECLG